MVKPIYVTKPSVPPMEEYIEEIRDIWDTRIMTHQGPKHNKLQGELESFLQVKHATLFANGHLALEFALAALGITGEVITTPFTFASTTQAILRNNCTPVFCDIDAKNYTINADLIEDLITDKTTAIVPVHVYGNICDVEKIQKIADKHHLKVIYDAAHAFGETYNGQNVASFGDATMFSFHATKVFNTVEGGALTYSRDEYVQPFESIRQFGQIVGTDTTPFVGSNGKMTEFHAAMGLCNLRHFKEYVKQRQKVFEAYYRNLEGIEGLTLNHSESHTVSNYAYFPVIVEEKNTGVTRDDIISALNAEGVFPRKYFWPLCSDFEIVRARGITSNVPVAKYISDRVITLPCYPELPEDEIEKICSVIRNLYQK